MFTFTDGWYKWVDVEGTWDIIWRYERVKVAPGQRRTYHEYCPSAQIYAPGRQMVVDVEAKKVNSHCFCYVLCLDNGVLDRWRGCGLEQGGRRCRRRRRRQEDCLRPSENILSIAFGKWQLATYSLRSLRTLRATGGFYDHWESLND